MRVISIGSDVSFKHLGGGLKFSTTKPTIMLTMVALHVLQHTKLDPCRCRILWHDKDHAF